MINWKIFWGLGIPVGVAMWLYGTSKYGPVLGVLYGVMSGLFLGFYAGHSTSSKRKNKTDKAK